MGEEKDQARSRASATTSAERKAVGILSRKEAPSPAPERGLSRNKAGEANNTGRGTRHPNLDEARGDRDGVDSRKLTGKVNKDGGLTRTETPGKIRRMPEHLKIELDRQLSAGTFQSWRNLSKWFADNGYEISHAALHKYGQKFDRRLESIRLATEQARIVCEQFEGDDAQMQSALMRLVQTRLFEVLCAVNEKPKRVRVKKNGQTVEKVAPVNLTALARSVSGLVKAETEHRKWAERARGAVDEAKQKLEEARGKGLSVNAADQIRAVLMEV